MNKIIKPFLPVLFLLIYIYASAQKCIIQNNVLSISSSNINESYIERSIKSNQKIFKKSDIENLSMSITTCNNMLENKIAQIKSKISGYYASKNELTNLLDIKKLKEQIREKIKNKEKIKEEIKNDLKNINFKGLYIVVITGLGSFENIDDLGQNASHLITPQAVSDLNGTFITSLTEVENDVTVRDYIKSEVSGEMTVDYKFYDNYSRSEGIYVYLAKVGVSPLKKGLQSGGVNTGAQKKTYKVINVSIHDYQSILLGRKVSKEIVDDIAGKCRQTLASIKSENKITKETQKSILENGNRIMQKAGQEILDLKAQLNNRSKICREIIKKTTNVQYNASDIAGSLIKAIKYIDDKIEVLKQEKISEKEKELMPVYNKIISAEGDAFKEIAKNIVSITRQLKKDYSSISNFLEVVEVRNAVTDNYYKAQTRDVYRDLEKIWIYILPGSSNNFNLTVVAKFKITGIKKGGGGNTITTASGLKYVITKKGNGKKPQKGDRVTLHYTCKSTDNTIFDSSVKRGQTFSFILGIGQVIKGWDEGIALLQVGDKATFTIPPDLGYGSRAMGKIPANATLIFDVELIGVK